jgi:arabinogalactan oligomer / maltooligosaccharide transport system permease protein
MSTINSTEKQGFFSRLANINTSGEKGGRALPLWRQLVLQLVCLIILAEVLFPIMYVVTLAFSSQTTRPSSLQLFPKEISLGAFKQVLDHPTANPVTFIQLLRNSSFLSIGVGAIALLIAVSAAYAFARFKFPGRAFLMVLVFIPLLMPAVGLSTPLYLLLNGIKMTDATGRVIFNLRDSLYGVGIAMIASALPFAVWNLKGYLDTIPKELEEAAMIDGASFNRVFFQIVLPLAAPQLAVTFFLGFIGYWQEFAMSWLFLSKPENYTLAMTLYNMTGQYAQNIPWNRFSAFALIVALPVAVVYIALQNQIVGGLTAGGVKE